MPIGIIIKLVGRIMIEIETTEDHRTAAKEQAKRMNHAGSMMRGTRDAHAALAEIVACEYVGGEMVRDYNHDFKTWWGLKVDVKSKVLSFEPKDYYDVSIFAYTEQQGCDFLLFTATPKDGSKVWICGGYGKQAFLRDATLKKAGEMVGSNGLTYKRDNYVMQIKDIGQAEPVVKMLRGENEAKARPLHKILQSIHTLEELEGLANRRKWLRSDLPRWTEAEIAQIKERKWQIENL